MQTFLPRVSFSASAADLDSLRLGKQITETWQILLALTEGRGYVHHPATLMWAGYERALCLYGQIMAKEWTVNRGRRYEDVGRFARLDRELGGEWVKDGNFEWPTNRFRLPPWLGDPAFHGSHRANLVRKLESHYGSKYPGQPGNRPYIWPVFYTEPAAALQAGKPYYLALSVAEQKRSEQWELPANMKLGFKDVKGRRIVSYKEDA